MVYIVTHKQLCITTFLLMVVVRIWSAQWEHSSVNKVSPRLWPTLLSSLIFQYHYLSVCLCPSHAALSFSFTPLPLLIYSLWHVSSISSFTLHPTVHPSIPAAQPYSSASPSSSSLMCFHITDVSFIRNCGVLFWVMAQMLAGAWKF